jgi:hypothetical protein
MHPILREHGPRRYPPSPRPSTPRPSGGRSSLRRIEALAGHDTFVGGRDHPSADTHLPEIAPRACPHPSTYPPKYPRLSWRAGRTGGCVVNVAHFELGDRRRGADLSLLSGGCQPGADPICNSPHSSPYSRRFDTTVSAQMRQYPLLNFTMAKSGCAGAVAGGRA